MKEAKIIRPMRLIALLLLMGMICSVFCADACAEYVIWDKRIAIDKDVPEKGSVQTMLFEYNGFPAHARVYTPYGYDPEDRTTAYDVLILLPGASGDVFAFLDNSDGYTGAQVLDHLFYHKLAKPVIAATISSFQTMGSTADDFMINYVRTLTESVDQNFNTYGNPDIQASPEDGGELRDHRVLAGFCLGADVMESVILPEVNDLFSRYGFFSTLIFCGDDTRDRFAEANREYPIREAVFAAERNVRTFEEATMSVADAFDKLGIANARFTYTHVPHSYSDSGFVSLYNFVQYIFGEPCYTDALSAGCGAAARKLAGVGRTAEGFRTEAQSICDGIVWKMSDPDSSSDGKTAD